ncbi:uncharacterized protein METZ01_LOCUS18106, partial [marine metagenome]
VASFPFLALYFSGEKALQFRLTHSGTIGSFTARLDAVRLTAKAP